MNPQPSIHGVGPGGRILIGEESLSHRYLRWFEVDMRLFRGSLALILARKDALLPEQRDGLATFLRELAAETADAITTLGGHRFRDAVTSPSVEQGIAEAMPSKEADPAPAADRPLLFRAWIEQEARTFATEDEAFAWLETRAGCLGLTEQYGLQEITPDTHSTPPATSRPAHPFRPFNKKP
jgi:hypothetical protein